MIFELFYYSFIALVLFQAVLLLQDYLENRGIVSTASTADSKPAGRGSNPRSSAKKRKYTTRRRKK